MNDISCHFQSDFLLKMQNHWYESDLIHANDLILRFLSFFLFYYQREAYFELFNFGVYRFGCWFCIIFNLYWQHLIKLWCRMSLGFWFRFCIWLHIRNDHEKRLHYDMNLSWFLNLKFKAVGIIFNKLFYGKLVYWFLLLKHSRFVLFAKEHVKF